MRPRVLLVQPYAFYGSTESYVRELIDRLDPELELWLLAPDARELEPLTGHARLSGRVLRLDTGRRMPPAVRAQAAAVRRLRPDLVHCADVDPVALVGAWLGGSRAVVVTYNTPELRPRDNALGALLRRAAWTTRPWTIFTSKADRATALRLDPVDPARAVVIPFGIDGARFTSAPGTLRAELGLADGVRLVGTVGLLRRQKDHASLVDAAAEVLRLRDDVVFVVAGEGELREELEARIRARGLESRFQLLGQRDDVPNVLASLDVFALPSRFEGMCLAVAEALAAERPVVATRVGGVPESVVDGETGLLVPPGDPGALARGLVRLLDAPAEAASLARAGRARVLRLYSLDRMAAQTAELYRRALEAV